MTKGRDVVTRQNLTKYKSVRTCNQASGTAITTVAAVTDMTNMMVRMRISRTRILNTRSNPSHPAPNDLMIKYDGETNSNSTMHRDGTHRNIGGLF